MIALQANETNHHERGRLLFDQERWAMAAEAFVAHLATHPADSGALAMLAIALAKASPKNAAAARSASDESLRLDANSAYCLYARAIIALHVDVPAGPIGAATRIPAMSNAMRLRASRHFANLAIAADATHLPTWRLLARVALALNEPAPMRAAAEHALRLAPTDAAALGLRARSFEIAGQHAAALAAADEGLAIAPNDATLQSVRAWALLQRGHDAAAEQGFVEALRINPTDDVTQKGLREARHNLKATTRWWQIRLTKDKPRRLRSNQVVTVRKASPYLGLLIAASALGRLFTDDHSTRPASHGATRVDLPSCILIAVIVVVVVLFFAWRARRAKRK